MCSDTYTWDADIVLHPIIIIQDYIPFVCFLVDFFINKEKRLLLYA